MKFETHLVKEYLRLSAWMKWQHCDNVSKYLTASKWHQCLNMFLFQCISFLLGKYWLISNYVLGTPLRTKLSFRGAQNNNFFLPSWISILTSEWKGSRYKTLSIFQGYFDQKVGVWKVTCLFVGTCALELIVLNFKSWQKSRENIGKEKVEWGVFSLNFLLGVKNSREMR